VTDPKPDLAAIEARVGAATEGPWECSLVGIDAPVDEYVVQTEALADVVCRLNPAEEFIEGPTASPLADAEFIAHARTDVPALVARVRELEEHADHTSCVQAWTNLAARATAAEAVVARVGALVDECASSGCIHLNEMWGRLRAALATPTTTEGSETDG
jgi:hypothetical protein